MTNLNIADIRINGGTQSRASIDKQVVGDYADAMLAGDTFPPLIVYHDGANYWLADGFHRYEAYASAKIDQVPADVRQGTQRDAILFSVGANAVHGLRRTNDDKRRAVLTLLNDKEWAKWSNREIAKACGVSEYLVRDIRGICDKNADASVRMVKRNGKAYEQNTANIGKRSEPTEPKPLNGHAALAKPTASAEPEPAAAESAPADPERRKLAKLTPDALIDEVLGLRSDLKEAKATVKTQAAEIKALKEQVKSFEGDQAEVIRNQANIIRHKEAEMYRANDTADRALARAKKLEKRVAELEKMGIEV